MAKRGLGSDKMSDQKKREIQQKGGRASGGNSGSKRNKQGRGSNLSQEDRARGGRNSHSGGRQSQD